jgi:hypothetical protein
MVMLSMRQPWPEKLDFSPMAREAGRARGHEKRAPV